MAYIYYIWSGNAHGRGGYIGLDSGSALDKNSRMMQHIYGPKGINSTSPDSAARFIVEKGISNVFYGYWDESEGYGIHQSVFNDFIDAGWNIGAKGNQKLMMAEVFHIIYDLEHNLQRTSSQITIGGQSTGVISYKPNKQFAGKPLQPVKIHIGDRIMSWKEEKQKLFFPEQYAITKEVMKKHLVAFLHTKKLWDKVVESYVVPRWLNKTPRMNPSTYLAVKFNSYLKKLDKTFAWENYDMEPPQIDFDRFVNEFEVWFYGLLGKSLEIRLKNWSRRKTISSKLFKIRMHDYVQFTPKNNCQPAWFKALQSESLLVPNNRTPKNLVLVRNIQIAATKVFGHIVEETQKLNLTPLTMAPSEDFYLKNRVEHQMGKHGFRMIHFYNWDLSYRYYMSAWMSMKKTPLIAHEVEDNAILASSRLNPNFYYYFTPTTWEIISSTTRPQDIPFHLL